MKIQLWLRVTSLVVFLQIALGGLLTFSFITALPHIITGFAVLAFAIVTLVMAQTLKPPFRPLQGLSVGLVLLVVVQIILGFTTLSSGNQVIAWVPHEDRLTLIPVAVFAAIVAKNCLLYVNSVLFSWLNSQVGHRLRSGIFNQLLTVSYGFVERSESGKLLNTLTTETWRAGDALSAFVDLLVACCTILIFITLLLLISWPLTLMATAAIPRNKPQSAIPARARSRCSRSMGSGMPAGRKSQS